MGKLRLAVIGAAGRMGRRIVALATEDAELMVTAALDAVDHPQMGQDAGVAAGVGPLGVLLRPDLSAPADVAVDFSSPHATDHVLALCREHRLPLVFATTGISPEQQQRLEALSREIPIVQAPNMSLAVNLAMKLAQTAAAALKAFDADVEILERHHRFKEDAPSGTALEFGRVISREMGQTVHRHGREGRPGKRPRNEIGYHAVRVGDNPGEHDIVFGLLGETVEIIVRATNRDAYAKGALAAAKFVARQPPGLYSMRDVLKL